MKKSTVTLLVAPLVALAAVLSFVVFIGSPIPRDECAVLSLDANGVARGGTGYMVMSYNIRGAQLSAASAGMSKGLSGCFI